MPFSRVTRIQRRASPGRICSPSSSSGCSAISACRSSSLDADENYFATCRACHPAETGSAQVQLATLYGSLSFGKRRLFERLELAVTRRCVDAFGHGVFLGGVLRRSDAPGVRPCAGSGRWRSTRTCRARQRALACVSSACWRQPDRRRRESPQKPKATRYTESTSGRTWIPRVFRWSARGYARIVRTDVSHESATSPAQGVPHHPR